jgi:hypothetical protein
MVAAVARVHGQTPATPHGALVPVRVRVRLRLVAVDVRPPHLDVERPQQRLLVRHTEPGEQALGDLLVRAVVGRRAT